MEIIKELQRSRLYGRFNGLNRVEKWLNRRDNKQAVFALLLVLSAYVVVNALQFTSFVTPQVTALVIKN